LPDSTIIYTHTDEAPALATYSFLPVIQAYASTAGVRVETRDISLAGRIIASFPEYLEEGQRIGRRPGRAGRADGHARGQHHQAAPTSRPPAPSSRRPSPELQGHGYALPDFPDDPKSDEERTSAPGTTR
jgi:isocitrate dehydrogenase